MQLQNAPITQAIQNLQAQQSAAPAATPTPAAPAPETPQRTPITQAIQNLMGPAMAGGVQQLGNFVTDTVPQFLARQAGPVGGGPRGTPAPAAPAPGQPPMPETPPAAPGLPEPQNYVERAPAPYVPPEQSQTLPTGESVMPGGFIMTPAATETQTQTRQGADVRPFLADLERERKKSEEFYSRQATELEKMNAIFSEDEGLKWAYGTLGAERRAAIEQDPERMRKFTETMTALKTKFDDAVKTAATRVDPNKFWKSRTTGQRVEGALALLLGGFAQGMGKMSDNPAAKILDDAIARDIAAQEFNAAAARQEAQMIGEQMNNEMTMKTFEDRQKVERLAQIDAFIASRLNELAPRVKTLEQKQALERAQFEFEQRLNDDRMAWLQLSVPQVVTTTVNKGPSAKFEPGLMAVQTPLGQAYDKEPAQTVRTAYQTHQATNDVLDRMEKYVLTVGDSPQFWNKKQQGDAENLAKEWIGLQQTAMNSGTLGESEYARYLKSSPVSPNFLNIGMTRDQAIALIEGARRRNDEALVATASAMIPTGQARFPMTLVEQKKAAQRKPTLQQMYSQKSGMAGYQNLGGN